MNKYLIEIKAEHDRDLGAGAKEELVARLEQIMEDEGFDQIDTVCNNQPAGTTEGAVFRMAMGKITLGPNGLAVVSTERDPAELWLAAPVGQKILGFLSGGIDRGDNRFIQLMQIQLCVDDRFSQPTGLIKFLLLDPRRPGPEDRQMQPVLALAVDGLWLGGLPHPQGQPGGPI